MKDYLPALSDDRADWQPCSVAMRQWRMSSNDRAGRREHSTSQITEMYYVKKDTARLNGIADGFNL